MVRKRKSGFLTFCFSLLPGAGEMYLGFMKMGVSLMGLFFGIWMLCVLLNVYFFAYAEVVLWFYSFFHAHNLAGLTDEEFLKVEDEFLFHLDVFPDVAKNAGKYRSIVAVILIIIGGLRMIRGKEEKLKEVIIDVEPGEMKEEKESSRHGEDMGTDLTPELAAERRAYGTEAEHKNP